MLLEDSKLIYQMGQCWEHLLAEIGPEADAVAVTGTGI